MIVGATITFQVEVLSILIISAIILGLILAVNLAVKKADPLDKPKGILLLAVIYVRMMSGLAKDNMGNIVGRNYAPYLGILALYLALANLSGLFGMPAPTANFSVTLTLALITFIMIQRMSIKSIGFFGYIRSFFEPHPLFFLMNFFGKVAPLISMSIRLFGNITSGTIIMVLFYAFTGWVAALVPIIGVIDFVGPIVAPVLHFYFDVFVGLIQMYIFISLTSVFIGNEYSQPE